MRTVVQMSLGMAVILSGALLIAQADEKKADKKPITLKGTMVCGKCTLKQCDKCTNVLQVKFDDGKTVNYFISDKGKEEKYHEAICKADNKQKAEVTLQTSYKQNGKEWIEPVKKDGVKIIDKK